MEGNQDNKANPYNDSREYQQKSLVDDAKSSHVATEHQSKSMLLMAEVHEDTTLAQQSSSTLEGTCHWYICLNHSTNINLLCIIICNE